MISGNTLKTRKRVAKGKIFEDSITVLVLYDFRQTTLGYLFFNKQLNDTTVQPKNK